MTINKLAVLITISVLASLACPLAIAGPPFITDDPEPVEFKHWEIYLFSIYNHGDNGDFAQAPAVEINYGVLPNMQLHLIPAGAFARAPGSSAQFGYGDTEFGIKYRFVQESDWIPQVGTFPLVEIPTGDSGRGLGNGQTQLFLPIWLQKTFGHDKEWTTFGGGGLWRNPGVDRRNFFRFGWEIQRDLSEHLTLGGEIYHETSAFRDMPGHTAFNLGGYLNLNEHNHVLFSAGRDINGPNRFALYLGYQLTF